MEPKSYTQESAEQLTVYEPRCRVCNIERKRKQGGRRAVDSLDLSVKVTDRGRG